MNHVVCCKVLLYIIESLNVFYKRKKEVIHDIICNKMKCLKSASKLMLSVTKMTSFGKLDLYMFWQFSITLFVNVRMIL